MYQLNTNAARQAEQLSSWINEPGKYIGTFICAEHVTSGRKRSQGIKFTFETQGRQKGSFTLWILDVQSKELYGYQHLNALMVCLRLKNIKAIPGSAKKWDESSQSMISSPAQVFAELTDQKIGMLLDTEEYEKKDGSIGIKVAPVGFFDAKSELMASEILDQKVQPEQLAKMVRKLKHRPLKHLSHPSSGNAPSVAANNSSHQFGDMDDDIPF
ncbi:MAG: hypothetical protein ON057_001532 [Glomeribacter sp. 1016415]|nr:hypothetical protein [Glomeribacter sp. 1016415]